MVLGTAAQLPQLQRLELSWKEDAASVVMARGLHSSTSQLNQSRA
jgi:hypothetical protein